MHASEFARRCDSPSGARAVTGGSSTHYEMAIGPVAGCFHRSIKIAGATPAVGSSSLQPRARGSPHLPCGFSLSGAFGGMSFGSVRRSSS